MSATRPSPPRGPLQAAATLLLDASAHIVWTSAAVQDLLDRTGPELRGRDLLSLVRENALYLARLLTEPRWLDLGHDAIWSSAAFARADGSHMECLVRVRRAEPDSRLSTSGFELRLEPHRSAAAARPAGAPGHRTPGTGDGGRLRARPGLA